jgi:hypothetical protein
MSSCILQLLSPSNCGCSAVSLTADPSGSLAVLLEDSALAPPAGHLVFSGVSAHLTIPGPMLCSPIQRLILGPLHSLLIAGHTPPHPGSRKAERSAYRWVICEHKAQ